MTSASHPSKTTMPEPEHALTGRETPMEVPERHFVSGHRVVPPFPDGLEVIDLGMGCFWGAERLLWGVPGVYATAVGYAGGFTPNPTYEEVCSGRTGHAEVVRVVHEPSALPRILKAFWEGHDPSQGMRQGADVGTQYRSVVFAASEAQREAVYESRDAYDAALAEAGHDPITTEIEGATPFYYAEAYHQQYLAKNPGGYCGHGGTGIACPIGLAR